MRLLTSLNVRKFPFLEATPIRRAFHGISLWRGTLWRGSQDPRQTCLDEAGNQRQSYLWVGWSKLDRTVEEAKTTN